VAVPVRVRRVVSLAPNITDILYALGVGGKIAGITNFATVPKCSAPKPSVGYPIQPSIENIVSLKPDLVLVSKTINRLDTVESLDRLGIPVYATDTRTVKGMLATIGSVARLVGAGQAGAALRKRLERRLNALRERLAGRKPKRVLFVEWEDPLITTGRDTFLADALRWAGAESVVNLRENWPHVSLEAIVYLQPDDLIFPASSGGTASEIRRALLRRPGWKELKALQQGRVLVVSDAINRPSPELVDAIEELARELHPAAFRESGAREERGARKKKGAQKSDAGARAVHMVVAGGRPWQR
jgi:iron complex transport system substrate-binding protein